ncbi:hypothetical protein Ahy_A08g039412 [Arachis hypogaea]|uniref:Uncharacterized protein n=1 Tax=Arachis hypogaea TaxID=3818 RepID=A0A445BW87_ARAHY|nr:hypothetical protein Ahy_A08g039412 [Arachis hypogaea]
MKGVYDAWKKAAPFTYQSRIIHKGGFLTLEEAKESFRKYETLHPEQTLKRADKAPIQTQRTGIIRNIPTRALKSRKRKGKRNEIEEREMRLLVDFESAFYNLSGLLEKLPEGIKRNLCYLIKDREDHKCQLCVSELSEESNNETESTHIIKEEDNASEGHIMKEEDSTSEASLNIIA